MRTGLTIGLLFALSGVVPSIAQVQKVSCFEEYLPSLRLSELEEGIAHCNKVIDDKAAVPDQRGMAFAQRGLMYARQWSLFPAPNNTLAQQAISDLSDGLQMHTPPTERRHGLLMVRARLYAGIGQNHRAADDFTAVLREDPANKLARDGLARVSPPAPSQ